MDSGKTNNLDDFYNRTTRDGRRAGTGHAGKGDADRRTNLDAYRAWWDETFGKKTKRVIYGKLKGKKNGKTTYTY